MKAIRMFKDEYLLDFINVEDIDAQEKDVDERLVEQRIVHNIKRFIMTLGRDFTFVGNQYHLEIYGEEMWSDLLFFNRELNALVAIELKIGKFKPIYLGQLYAYLQVLDDKVRKPHENPSIGIVLCKSANQAYAEYAVRDYNKPMGVATYKTISDMPVEMQKTLPDIEELKKWVRYCMDDARITTVSRLWHPFHCLPKSYREHVTYNGSPLVEAMDVKNCYYVLMVKALQLADKIDPDELRRFEALVRDGDIYMEIGNDIQFIHEIKEDYNDDDYLSFIGTTRRDRVKVEMQSFRNYKTYGQAESQHPMLAKKFKELFPSICHWLFTYPIYRNRKGKNAKRLQADMSRIETMLISKVCFRLKDMGLNPFTLHDAIYLSREELDIVGKGFVDKLFWEVFDATTEEDVRRALEYRYNKEEGKV